MPLTCPSCQAPQADASARFCEDCGGPLVPGAGKGSASKASGCRCAVPDVDAEGYCQACGIRVAAPPRAPDFELAVDARLAVASDKGRRHPTNQDNGSVVRRADGVVLMVVADGVSTSEGAEAASAAAVQAAVARFEEAARDASHVDLARACVEAAAIAVLALPKVPSPDDDGPATTIVLAVVRDRSVGLAWIGDSRAYSVMSGVPETPLTKDDSWCVQQVDAGRMTHEKAMAHPDAHAITQWLGMPRDEMKVRCREMTLPPGASLLLCSDGLWNHVDAPRRMGTAYTEARRYGDAAQACRRLVALANDAGGHDNVTVALLDLA